MAETSQSQMKLFFFIYFFLCVGRLDRTALGSDGRKKKQKKPNKKPRGAAVSGYR